MKLGVRRLVSLSALLAVSAALAALGVSPALASGGGSVSGGSGGSGGGSTSVKVDTIKVSKCFYDLGGEMLLKAASSDPSATLSLYGPDDRFLQLIQNGGGSRYGGTPARWLPQSDPVFLTIRSSSGGSVVCFTTPFVI